MKYFLVSLVLISFCNIAQADLLDRLRLEEALKNRLENSFRIHDPKAQVLVRFDYKSFRGTLPGTTLETQGEVNPFNIDSSDITRVTVEIYTSLEDIPAEAKSLIFQSVPIEKSKISVNYKKLLQPLPNKKTTPSLDPQSLSNIAQDTMENFLKVFALLTGSGLLLSLAFLFQQNSRKLKEFKQQVQLLTAALAETGGRASSPQIQNTTTAAPPSSRDDRQKAQLTSLGVPSLKELFSDCYWCHEDGYAHWLWRQLEAPQRAELLNRLPLLKDYSLYFVTLPPQELSYHDHPYYLDPQTLNAISQEDLSTQVRITPTLWHFLSPLRQQNLPLTLEERLQAIQTRPDTGNKPLVHQQSPSPARTLESKASWGDISSEDEETLYQHPEMVPPPLRENIRSLVWLAQKESSYIQAVLARYDARSLASAWVGPEAVLKKLEAQLPEKKLKILQSYLEKTPASRHSEVYGSLVAEGFKNEAA